jgi:hypothetical protein
VPGMPKLRHIGLITFVRLLRFQSLRKSEFAVPTFSEVWLPPRSSSRRSTGPVRYWTVRRGRRFGYVASMGYQSLITHSTRFACSGRASHLSLFICHKSLTLSLLTNHLSPLTAAHAAQRYRPPFELRASSTR